MRACGSVDCALGIALLTRCVAQCIGKLLHQQRLVAVQGVKAFEPALEVVLQLVRGEVHGVLTSSKFTGGEQQAGLSVGHAVEQADAAQHAVKGLQAVGLQFGNDIPAAIGGVQATDGRVAAQGNQ